MNLLPLPPTVRYQSSAYEDDGMMPVIAALLEPAFGVGMAKDLWELNFHEGRNPKIRFTATKERS